MRRQCNLLGLNRSTLYYNDKPITAEDIDIINSIRDIWEKYPFYGYRRITKELQFRGLVVNRKKVLRLMNLCGLHAIYPGPNTSRRNKSDAIHPYLLDNLLIVRPNQAWQVDITYLRMSGGFMYLVAIVDVYSRYVVSWSLSNTLETAFCVEALTKGLTTAKPEIMNSDQGSQFTSDEWINYLIKNNIKISMTGKGRCLDNVYVERFWRSFKQEEFYLNEYENVKELRFAIGEYIEFYNHRRWHQSLGYKTPAEFYFVGEKTGEPVVMWTSPTNQPAPFGTCGQTFVATAPSV